MDRDWFNGNDEEEKKLYVFDSDFVKNDPCCPVPYIFAAFFSHRYDHIAQFILGPPDSGAPQHFHSDAINCLAFGRKYWVLFPPAYASYLKEDARSWMAKQDFTTGSDVSFAAQGCLQESGDVIYVPRFYGHSVINFDQSIAVAYEFDRGAEC